GEAVGTYAISQGSVTAGGNYTISFTGANLTITPAPLPITADEKTQVYGAMDPALTYQVSGLVNGDTAAVVTGSLTRAGGEAGGNYWSRQGSRTACGNYTISFPGANLTITPSPLTITADAKTKVYGAMD